MMQKWADGGSAGTQRFACAEPECARRIFFYDSACAILSVDDRRRGVGEFEMKLRPLCPGGRGLVLLVVAGILYFFLSAGGRREAVDAYLAS